MKEECIEVVSKEEDAFCLLRWFCAFMKIQLILGDFGYPHLLGNYWI